MRKYLSIQTLLWLALVLALAGSLRHVAHVFTTIDNNQWWGLVQALAVDAGLLALALGIMQRRRLKRPAKWLWVGVGLFSSISVYANLAYGLEFTTVLPDWISHSKPYVMAATLPVLVIYLSEIVGSDWNHTVQAAEKAERKLARKSRRVFNSDVQFRVIEHETEHKPEQLPNTPELPAIGIQSRRAKKQRRLEQLAGLLANNPDATTEQLCSELNISRTTLYTYKNELNKNGVQHDTY